MVKDKKLPKVIRRLLRREGTIDVPHIADALEYIEEHWKVLTHEEKQDSGMLIGLPHPYVVPSVDASSGFTLKEQYYWDSYFNSLGLVGKHQKLAENMLDNLVHIFNRFTFIPNASQMYHMSHSQPPVLTTYIRLIYETGQKDLVWLQKYMAVAEREYEKVWMSETHPFWHKVHHGLSRYYDINVLHDMAEAESGWDMTPRFERKCLDYLPVDLNALLYKYETDFAWVAHEAGDEERAKHWEKQASKRKHEMNKYMWHKRKGFYFDYNYNKGEKGGVWSLAAFFPMWAGMVTKEQAVELVRNLDKFEHVGGLTATTRPLIDMSIFGSIKTQWAHPNGWAPLHWIVIEALRRYGYNEEAERIARKWLRTNLAWYERHNEFLEKYNVVKPQKPPVEGVYPSQKGFGWTNAIFVKLCKDFLDK